MCGIVGYIGNNRASDVIIKGLRRLEYRGYDSAGIATFEDGSIELTKCQGKVINLEKQMKNKKHDGNVGIGHTRWATHGIPNDLNAHPHKDNSGKFTLIHNGIIENYSALKTLLLTNGIECKTETDTEVLVQFIAYLYEKENLSFSETVRLALKRVVGAYGIVVLCEDEPDVMVVARYGSPLVFGIGDNEFIVASDTSPIIDYTRKIIYLDEGEMAVLTHDSYEIRSINDNHIVTRDTEEVEYTLEQIEKGGYDHFMLKEIFYQPESISDALRGRVDYQDGSVKLGGIQDQVQNILQAKQIFITACGTSWHAALIGGFLIEELLHKSVKVEYASEFRYRRTTVDSESVVIAISQSGETADTLAAIKKAKSLGALTVGVVNVVGSSIARETDCGVYVHAGPEIGVASTKAFTSQVTVLNLIASFLAQKAGKDRAKIHQILRGFESIPHKIEEVLKLSDDIKAIAEDYKDTKNFLYLGRGYQFPVALEGALKLKEISYIHAEGYPAAEMKHGPIALIDNEMPVVFLVTENQYDKVLSNIREVKSRGGRIIIVTSVYKEELKEYSDHIIHVPKAHNLLMPLIMTVPLQLLSYFVAVAKECNVDQPRNLAKSVTVE
jgi:glutamine---fructose-6-phosphate transaminase (isomerizing)